MFQVKLQQLKVLPVRMAVAIIVAATAAQHIQADVADYSSASGLAGINWLNQPLHTASVTLSNAENAGVNEWIYIFWTGTVIDDCGLAGTNGQFTIRARLGSANGTILASDFWGRITGISETGAWTTPTMAMPVGANVGSQANYRWLRIRFAATGDYTVWVTLKSDVYGRENASAKGSTVVHIR